MMAFDDRSRHATVIELVNKTNVAYYFMKQDVNDYMHGGFQKMCK